ncbi:hypothetical protein [Crenobacter intestini]|uniref:Uncharacterized protein n=1 Tax=Crenobacter intestini TaxID=2563443 RepID=A0A4T0V717_9NEIS|nr:hypothetical protein [Crenobacter intestini]TIC87177.1 hypothetical protein E5K04_01810 [Crenobacter intestini]
MKWSIFDSENAALLGQIKQKYKITSEQLELIKKRNEELKEKFKTLKKEYAKEKESKFGRKTLRPNLKHGTQKLAAIIAAAEKNLKIKLSGSECLGVITLKSRSDKSLVVACAHNRRFGKDVIIKNNFSGGEGFEVNEVVIVTGKRSSPLKSRALKLHRNNRTKSIRPIGIGHRSKSIVTIEKISRNEEILSEKK